MTDIKMISCEPRAEGARVAIVASRYNETIVDRLLSACLDCLLSRDVHKDSILVTRVPGAYELPLLARLLARKNKFDAIIALGAIIRGDTPHFEYIATECAHGLADTALEFNVPVIFGVLTVDDYEQAMLRSGGEESNKGTEAALTALETIAVQRSVENE